MKPILKMQLQSKKVWVLLLLSFVLFYSCNSNSSGNQSDSSSTVAADSKSGAADKIVPPKNPEGFSAAVGAVLKISSTEIDIKTKDQTLAINITDSLHIYATSPSSIDSINSTSYIGVASRKQADGSDQASQVILFPEELRGLNEGSFMLDGNPDPKGGRMTNGSASRMTNGSASRMSNGNVKKTNGASLTIQYQGSSRTVNITPAIPVIVYKVTERKLAPGDKVFALIKKTGNGTYQTSKILIL